MKFCCGVWKACFIPVAAHSKGLATVEHGPGEDASMASIFDRVFIRQSLSCEDPVEVPYFSSVKFDLVCTHCGCPYSSSVTLEGQYPLCSYCKFQGKNLKSKRKPVSN